MVDLKAWLPVCMSAVMMLIGVITLVKSTKKDSAANVTEFAKLSANIQSIMDSLSEIKAEARLNRQDVRELSTRIAKVEASTASAHKRIDEIVRERGERT